MLRTNKFVMLFMVLLFLSCTLKVTPITIEKNEKINQKVASLNTQVLNNIFLYSMKNNKSDFENLYLSEIQKEMGNNFIFFKEFIVKSKDKVTKHDKYYYQFSVNKDDEYIDTSTVFDEVFYPNIYRRYKKILMNYKLITFNACEYIETVAIGRDNDSEDFKIFYHYINPYSFKNKNVIDFNDYLNSININDHPVAAISTLMLMSQVANPSYYLRFIDNIKLESTFSKNDEFIKGFFKKPYVVKKIKTKPMIIQLGFDLDNSFENIIYKIYYISNSRNINAETNDFKNYLIDNYPNFKEFYDIIEFHVYNKVPNSMVSPEIKT